MLVSKDTHEGDNDKVFRLTRKELQKFLYTIIAGKTICGIFEGVHVVNFNSFDHESDVVWLQVAIEI
jgi:hypothetical protein